MTDKDSRHSYLQPYRELTDGMAVDRVLEIGVLEGSSLALWQEWWPDAEIHGVDNHLRPEAPINAPRAVLHQADAYHADFCCNTFGADCDLIIDDGDHQLHSMVFVAAHYPQHLRPGGVLVIEDIPHESWIPKLEQATPPELRDRTEYIDRTTVEGTAPDSRLFVIRR
ncbi:MAG TPA: class I SAM-dependent methyltransferase [Acidimicrobiia bacterium]